MIDFKDRVAFVTGGANGIGIGLVRALLAEGSKVAIADIRQEAIDDALAELNNPNAMGVRLDVSSREQMAKAAETVEAHFGVVTLLFNNAGVNLFQTIEESSYSDWDWLLGVNLHGPINGVMTFVPKMIAHGQGGYVVNTASMASILAGGQPGIYNTAKFAVRGMSTSLRGSLAKHNIGVSVVCPGLVKSYIYASDDIRPPELMEGAKPVDEENIERLAGVHDYGMEPDVIAARIIDGVKEDLHHIFTHPEFKEELQEVFDEMLDDFRDYPADPGRDQRLAFEEFRRDSYREQRKGLKK